MAEISVQLDEAQVREVQALLAHVRNGYPIAMQAAISRTLTSGRALLAREIAKEVNLRMSAIKGVITTTRPSLRRLAGVLSVHQGVPRGDEGGGGYRSVWLSDYMTARQLAGHLARRMRGKKLPVRVKVRKGSEHPDWPEEVPGAFVAQMPNSRYVGVFQRVGVKRKMKSGRHAGRQREVIRRLRGPAPLNVFMKARGGGGTTILEQSVASLGDTLRKNLDSQIRRVLEKRGISRMQAVAERALG